MTDPIREALEWALDYIADGLEVPPHDCEFVSNPEKGACDFHDRYFDARAALALPERGEVAELEHFDRRSDGDHITFFFPRTTCGHPLRFAGVKVRVTAIEEAR